MLPPVNLKIIYMCAEIIGLNRLTKFFPHTIIKKLLKFAVGKRIKYICTVSSTG